MKPFVDFATYNSSNPFGAVDPKYYPSTHHHIGSDFKVPVGTPIIAPEDGEMFRSLFNSFRGNTGVYIFKHGGVEWGLEFCHLRELPPTKTYKRGDVIAYSGNTGTATTAPHLHVTLHRDAMVSKNYVELTSEDIYNKFCKEGRIVDPYAWFKDHLMS